MLPTPWLIAGAAAMASLQLVLVVVVLVRNHWQDRRLLRARARLQELDAMFDELAAAQSRPLCTALARPELLRDLELLSAWLRGRDSLDEAARAALIEHGLLARGRQRLNSRRWSERAAAAELLGRLGAGAAVPDLLSRIRDRESESPAVRAAALRALRRISDPVAVPHLVALLGSSESWLPALVADALVGHGEEAVGPLLCVLNDTLCESSAQRWAATCLGSIASRRSVATLLGCLDHPDPELRSRVAHALGQIGARRACGPLLDRLLADPVPFVRTAVARALSQLGAEQAVEALVEALSDPEWWVRQRAVAALAQLGDPATELLRDAIHDQDPNVAHEAARALEASGVLSEVLERLRVEHYDATAHEFLIAIGKAGALDPLLEAVEDPDPRLVRSVLRILARIGDARAGESIARLLERADRREHAARALDTLRRIGAGAYVSTVLPHLRSDEDWVRVMAVDYLGEFADQDILPQIQGLLRDSNPLTREAVLRLLVRLRPSSDGACFPIELLHDDAENVAQQAIRTCCAVGYYSLLTNHLDAAALRTPPFIAAILDGVLQNPQPHAIPLLLGVCPGIGPNEWDRWALAATRCERLRTEPVGEAALGSTADRWLAALRFGAGLPHTLPPLLAQSLLRDPLPAVRAALLPQGLGSVEPQADAITTALADPERLVRRAAWRALALSRDPQRGARLCAAAQREDDAIVPDILFGLAFDDAPISLLALNAATLHRDPRRRVAAVVASMRRDQAGSEVEWIRVLRDTSTLAALHDFEGAENPLLRRILSDAERAAGEGAMRLLAFRTPFEVEQQLVRELDDEPDPLLRRRALTGLRALQSRRPVGRVRGVLASDPSPIVRAVALETLLPIEPMRRQLAYLRRAFVDPAPELRMAAARLCLVLPRAEAISLLFDHLANARGAVRKAIVQTLVHLAADDAKPLLAEAQGRSDRPEWMLALMEVLAQAAPPPASLLDLIFDHRSARVRALALRTLLPRLREDPLPRALAAIRDMSPMVRAEGLRQLCSRRLRGEGPVIAAVETCLGDPSTLVRRRAVLAVGVLGWDRVALLRSLGREQPTLRRAVQRSLSLLASRKPVEIA